MLPALQRAVEHPDMTEDLAEVLSTNVVEVEYAVETDVTVRDEEDRDSERVGGCWRALSSGSDRGRTGRVTLSVSPRH